MATVEKPAPEVTNPPVDAIAGLEDAGSLSVGSMVVALSKAVLRSGKLAKTGAGLSVEAVKIMAGKSQVEPAKGDWRFTDPTWTDHPGYRRLKQGYLAVSHAVDGIVDSADLEWRTRERARFAAGILTSAVAPTNTLPGNPAAMKRALETGGGSLLVGAKQFAGDLLHNGGMPKQVDASGFKLGENMATTPGAVVYRDEVFELLQYTPTTPKVRARPIVMIPPQINKYYFMDLSPGRSFIEHAVSKGIQFFVISWRNPQKEQGHWDLDTYGRAVLSAIDVAREITASPDVNVLGLCAGGILTTTVLSHLAVTGDDRVNAASFGVMLVDWDAPAMVGAFQSRNLLRVARRKSAKAGVLDARSLGSVFTWMRPNDLVWNYWVNNYLMGKKPPAFDILAWNDDKTNLPGALHAQFLDIFEGNLLMKPGALTTLGTPVDLTAIKVDTYVTGGLSDHLTPWEGCYRATQVFSGESTFVLSPTGHIQTQVSPPGNPKSHYFLGPDPGPDPHAWKAKAERHAGTWWDHWAAWNIARSGAERPAPAKLGSAKHRVLGPAPGTYVHQPA